MTEERRLLLRSYQIQREQVALSLKICTDEPRKVDLSNLDAKLKEAIRLIKQIHESSPSKVINGTSVWVDSLQLGSKVEAKFDVFQRKDGATQKEWRSATILAAQVNRFTVEEVEVVKTGFPRRVQHCTRDELRRLPEERHQSKKPSQTPSVVSTPAPSQRQDFSQPPPTPSRLSQQQPSQKKPKNAFESAKEAESQAKQDSWKSFASKRLGGGGATPYRK